MCYGYHSRMSREEQMELLRQRKKQLEERMKELERQMSELQPESQPSPSLQNA